MDRFDMINERMSELTDEQFTRLAGAYNDYMIFGKVSWFEWVCNDLSLSPSDVIYWWRYQ